MARALLLLAATAAIMASAASAAAAARPSPLPLLFVACGGGGCADAPQARRGAADVARYLYRQTGVLPELILRPDSSIDPTDDAGLLRLVGRFPSGGVVVTVSDEQASSASMSSSSSSRRHGNEALGLPSLAAGSHAVHSVVLSDVAARVGLKAAPQGAVVVAAAGGSSTDAMYACFTLLERLGVRFRVHEDVLSDGLVHRFSQSEVLQRVASLQTGPITPSFSLRGLQPFHDFSAGPDWWNEQEYRLVFEQMSKMKMNFLGLHTYPIPSGVPSYPDKPRRPVSDVCGMLSAPEPNVWIGLDGEFDPRTGEVNASYPSTFFTTWGFVGPETPGLDGSNRGVPMNTSAFLWGAGAAYSADDFGSEAQMAASAGARSNPGGLPQTDAENNALFNTVAAMFNRSFSYGRGTLGMKVAVGTEIPLSKPPSPVPPCTVTSTPKCLSELPGCARAMPGFAPTGMSRADMSRELCAGLCYDTGFTVAGVEFGSYCFCSNATPMTPAATTCNMSCSGNPSETCGGNCVLDVFTFSCAGPRGNASGAPTQAYYEAMFKRIDASYPIDYYWLWTPEGWEWSKVPVDSPLVTDAVADLEAASAAHASVKASFDLATCGWVLGPLGDRALLDTKLGPEFAALSSIEQQLGWWGPNPAYSQVKRERWDIPWMEDDGHLGEPEFWVARTVAHAFEAKTMGVDGLMGIHWRTRELSLQISALAAVPWASSTANPTGSVTAFDVYLDLCQSDFGMAAADALALAAELVRHDSFNAPNLRAAGESELPGNGGCGTYRPNGAWKTAPINETFAYVDTLISFRGKVMGAVNLDRFDYWIGLHRLLRSQAHCFAKWGEFNDAFHAAADVANGDRLPRAAADALLALRIELVRSANALMNTLMATVSSVGSMGTLSDFEQRGLPYMFRAYDAALVNMTGGPLPPAAQPPSGFTGSDRVFVPSPRGSVGTDERTCNVTAMVFSKASRAGAVLMHRVAPATAFESTPMAQMPSRQVFTAAVPNPGKVGAVIEWYVSISGSPALVWPPGGDASGGAFTTVVV